MGRKPSGSGNGKSSGRGRGLEPASRTSTLERQVTIARLLPYLDLPGHPAAANEACISRTALRQRLYRWPGGSRARSVARQIARLGLEAEPARVAESDALAEVMEGVENMAVREEAADDDVFMDVHEVEPLPPPPPKDDDDFGGGEAPPPPAAAAAPENSI